MVAMSDCNPLDTLEALSEDVLCEVVREGELQLQAQLQVSLAADSRGLTIAGFSLTASTALLGAAAVLARDARPDLPVILVAAALGVAMLTAGALAVISARPVRFYLPGNQPINWIPADWDLPPGARRTLKRARVEQAKVLQSMLRKNHGTAHRNAKFVHAALLVIFGAAVLAAVALALILLIRGIPA